MLKEVTNFVVFCLDVQRYALPLAAVERVVHAVHVTALPNAPAVVLGVIDVEGCLLPVLNLRQRFQLPERKVTPGDQFLLARTTHRRVALMIDEAQGIIGRSTSEIVGSAEIVPGLDQIQGVIKLYDGLVLINDLEKFLSLDESSALDQAMKTEVAH